MQSSDDYRSIYCRLLDDPEFQALSPEAQRLFFFLRFSSECGPTGLFRWYPAMTTSRMRISEADLRPLLEELTAGRWVAAEGGYLLIRNAMRFEPTFRPAKNAKQLVSVHRHITPLWRLRIAWELVENLDLPLPDEWVSKGYRKGMQGVSKGDLGPQDLPSLNQHQHPNQHQHHSRRSGGGGDDDRGEAAGCAKTATPDEPEFPPDDPDEDGDDLPPNPDPEPIPEAEASAYPWHPDDERDFGNPSKPHPRWGEYVELLHDGKMPQPWPRFLPWLSEDIKKRAPLAAAGEKALTARTTPMNPTKPLAAQGDSHVQSGT